MNNKLLFVLVISFFANTIIAAEAYSQASNYKSFPIKSVEYSDGSIQCGHYDEANKKLYNCNGKSILKTSVAVSNIVAGGSCCGEDHIVIIKQAATNVFFATGSSKLLSRSFTSLNAVVALMKENPNYKLEIDAYTDNMGNDLTNQELSEDRAASVKMYLISKGIDMARLTSMGYGETKPIADNKNAAGRAKNRRVEMVLKTE